VCTRDVYPPCDRERGRCDNGMAHLVSFIHSYRSGCMFGPIVKAYSKNINEVCASIWYVLAMDSKALLADRTCSKAGPPNN